MREKTAFLEGGGWPERVKVEVEIERQRWADAFLSAAALWFILTALWGLAKLSHWISPTFLGTDGVFPLWTDWVIPPVQILLLAVGLTFYYFEPPQKKVKILEKRDPNHPPKSPYNLY